MSAASHPLTIGHVVLSLDVGGLERVVATLARAQHRSGTRAIVYCLDRAGDLASSLPEAGVPVHVVRRRSHGFDAGAVMRLTRMLRSDGVSVVHCHNHGALVYGAMAARFAGIGRVVYTVHGAKTSGRRSTSRFQKAGLVREVVYVSSHAREVARTAGVPDNVRVHTVVNGIDPAAFEAKGRERETIRAELGIPLDARACGIIARLTPAKDHGNLFQAMHRLRTSRPVVHCIVVGDGELRESLETNVRELGLDRVVHFAGARQNVRDYLAAMDVFVLSSITEGLAVTLLEAMAAGLPIVATRVGGNPEVVVDGETGLLVPPRDSEALAAAIASLLDDPARAARMGSAGRDRVRQEFSLEALVRAYAAVYAASAQ
jgi:sugar transferase (PEP-CTERM/EpsH1 system associated)